MANLTCRDVEGAPECCPGCHVDADLGFIPLREREGIETTFIVCHPVAAWLDAQAASQTP